MSLREFILETNFSGHESFPLRFQWLKKGFDEIAKDPSFFQKSNALVVLGTGKNMTYSIRHWGLTCGIWEKGVSKKQFQPTLLGQALFSDNGCDPFLEHVDTIWLLHWKCVTNTKKASTWTWAFNRPKGNRFTKEEIANELQQLIDKENLKKVANTTLTRDVNTLETVFLKWSTSFVTREKNYLRSMNILCV